MAPVRDVSRDDADSALPDVGAAAGPAGHARSDRRAGGRRSGSAAGRPPRCRSGSAPTAPFSVDLREDGPHALIAGTTGAGKSELLQTLIASLAVANRPDEMTFVLIDYKGGSAFKDCARLPHTVGMVSDLDGHLTERALASLAAELHRRETILLDAGAKDIEDYNDARQRGRSCEPMPRLVLIIDEFASLVAELPDFVTGLVDIARRGRSLGVHLMLATQRPGGVVTADIRANTNLRIALRVTDADESRDVIDAPDSGAIAKSTPGRCLCPLRRAVAGRRAVRADRRPPPGGRRGRGPRPRCCRCVGRRWAGRCRAVRRATRTTAPWSPTWRCSWTRSGTPSDLLGFPAPRKPWLDPLPERIVAENLPPTGAAAATGDVPPIAFGLTDLPRAAGPRAARGRPGARRARADRRRSALGPLHRAAHDRRRARPRHLAQRRARVRHRLRRQRAAAAGDAAALRRRRHPRPARAAGAAAGPAVGARSSRRQQLLAVKGASSAAEQRAMAATPEERLPWMVLLLDNWEGYSSTFESYDYGKLIEGATRLFREGGSAGLKVVMTADRSGFIGAISSVFADKLILRMADPNDYATGGLSVREVPQEHAVRAGAAAHRPRRAGEPGGAAGRGPGRPGAGGGLAADRAAGHRADRTGRAAAAETAAADAGGRAAAADHPGPRAMALDPDFTPSSPLWALIGVGGDELAPVGIDLQDVGPGVRHRRAAEVGPLDGADHRDPIAARPWCAGGAGHPAPLAAARVGRRTERAGRAGRTDASADDLKELTGQADGRQFVVVVDDAELLYDTPLDDRAGGGRQVRHGRRPRR